MKARKRKLECFLKTCRGDELCWCNMQTAKQGVGQQLQSNLPC